MRPVQINLVNNINAILKSLCIFVLLLLIILLIISSLASVIIGVSVYLLPFTFYEIRKALFKLSLMLNIKNDFQSLFHAYNFFY